jgi:Mrp family chromosome partitioning ATPase
VIPAGQTPASPYEVLKSPRLGELLEEARQHYDYVIVDAPPLCTVQDCRVIANWVDGFLIVVAANRTARRLVEESLNVVEPGKILGFVFNGDNSPPSISYGYDGYYGGGPQPAPTSRDHDGPLGRAVDRFGQMLQRGRRRRR